MFAVTFLPPPILNLHHSSIDWFNETLADNTSNVPLYSMTFDKFTNWSGKNKGPPPENCVSPSAFVQAVVCIPQPEVQLRLPDSYPKEPQVNPPKSASSHSSLF